MVVDFKNFQNNQMISIKRATVADASLIAGIGSISVEAAHRESCSAAVMQAFISRHYNEPAIQAELQLPTNWYHLVYFNGTAAGFSKIILNTAHENINQKPVAKLDRLYLLQEYFDRKLGLALLNFNIELAKQQAQKGIWLYTWVDNSRALNFYRKAGFTIAGSHWFEISSTHANLNHQLFLPLP